MTKKDNKTCNYRNSIFFKDLHNHLHHHHHHRRRRRRRRPHHHHHHHHHQIDIELPSNRNFPPKKNRM